MTSTPSSVLQIGLEALKKKKKKKGFTPHLHCLPWPIFQFSREHTKPEPREDGVAAKSQSWRGIAKIFDYRLFVTIFNEWRDLVLMWCEMPITDVVTEELWRYTVVYFTYILFATSSNEHIFSISLSFLSRVYCNVFHQQSATRP